MTFTMHCSWCGERWDCHASDYCDRKGCRRAREAARQRYAERLAEYTAREQQERAR